MTEIERMFENAGISICKRKQGFTLKDCTDRECKKCGYYDLSFTAEKQIAVLMFILNKFGDIGFQKMYSIRGNDESTRKNFIKCLCDCEHETWDSRPVDFYYQNGASGDNLEESLAGLINSLWQSLTDQEKEEIRRILNENS